jgi:hypothetical protein
MSLSTRRLTLAATATALGIGGVLLPSASAMAATTLDPGATVTAAPFQNTAETAHATSAQPTDDEANGRVVKLQPANNYPHPWVSGFWVTYTFDYEHGVDDTGQYPAMLEVVNPLGPGGKYDFYLRGFQQKTWETLQDSMHRDMPVQIYVDDYAGVWCKWLRPVGPA